MHDDSEASSDLQTMCLQQHCKKEGELEEGHDSHDEYQGAWKVAINQGVVWRLNLHARQTSLHWCTGISTQS